jgi:hypothetical protein
LVSYVNYKSPLFLNTQQAREKFQNPGISEFIPPTAVIQWAGIRKQSSLNLFVPVPWWQRIGISAGWDSGWNAAMFGTSPELFC